MVIGLTWMPVFALLRSNVENCQLKCTNSFVKISLKFHAKYFAGGQLKIE